MTPQEAIAQQNEAWKQFCTAAIKVVIADGKAVLLTKVPMAKAAFALGLADLTVQTQGLLDATKNLVLAMDNTRAVLAAPPGYTLTPGALPGVAQKQPVINIPTVQIKTTQSQKPVMTGDSALDEIFADGFSFTFGPNGWVVIDQPTVVNKSGSSLSVIPAQGYGPVAHGIDPTKPPITPINVNTLPGGSQYKAPPATGGSATTGSGSTGVHGSVGGGGTHPTDCQSSDCQSSDCQSSDCQSSDCDSTDC